MSLLASVILSSGLVTLLVLCTVALLIHRCLAVITVEGHSMSPTLEDGDRVLILRTCLTTQLRKGQIVLVWPEHTPSSTGNLFAVSPYIKRIIALGGEICVTSSPHMLEAENPFQAKTENKPEQQHSWHIPQGHIFVCGDNRAKSIDSRNWGSLPIQNVLGLVLLQLPRKALSSSLQTSSRAILPCKQGLSAGKIAPAFTAQTLNNETVTLSSYRGETLLLFFIAATHVCHSNLSLYLAHASKITASRITFIFVSDDDIQKTQGFAEELHITLPVLIAPRDQNPFLKDYDITETPAYCLIDAQGIVQASGFPSQDLFTAIENIDREVP